MSKSVTELMATPTSLLYYDADFRVTLETHLNFLRTHPKTVMLDVNTTQAYRHEGDFYALLSEMKIPLHLHWLIMRMGNMTSPAEADREISFILHPPLQELELIRQRHLISVGKTN